MTKQLSVDGGAMQRIIPEVFGVNPEIRNIFSVPIDDAVGTNSIDDGISTVTFVKDAVKVEQRLPSILENASVGEFEFLPSFSDRFVGYARYCLFFFVDLLARKSESYTIMVPGEAIAGVGVVDGKENTFFFDSRPADGAIRVITLGPNPLSREYDPKNPDLAAQGISTTPQLGVPFIGSNDTHPYTVLFERKLIANPYQDPNRYAESPWTIYDKTIFILDQERLRFAAFDFKLSPVEHPLVAAINDLPDILKMCYGILVHPSVPVAFVSSAGDLHALKWLEPDKKKRMTPLSAGKICVWPEWSGGLSIQHVQLSPDGRYLVFSADEYDNWGNPEFFAAAIAPDRPVPVGPLIRLGRCLREDARLTGACWIAKPLSFVASDGLVLYRWKLPGSK